MLVEQQAANSNLTPVEFVTLREQYQLELIKEYYDAYYWRPRLQADEYRIGHVCINQTDKMPTKEDLKGLSAAPLVVRNVGMSEVLQAPNGWKRLFPPQENGPLKQGQLCLYRPLASEHFVALSDVAAIFDGTNESTFNPDPQFRCVHKALVRHSELMSSEIWKDNESTWNIQGSGFFMWASTEDFPNDLLPYVLNSGSIMSNLQLVDLVSTPSRDMELVPQYLIRSNFNNESDQKVTHTFEATRSQSNTVSGTWQRTNATQVGLKFGLDVEIVLKLKAGLIAEMEQSTKYSFENSVVNTETHSVGGGTTELQSTTFRQLCTVDVPPRGNVEVSAVIYKAKYDVTYTGKLRLNSNAPGAEPIEIIVSGTFAHQIDTEETWWEVTNGEFIEKKTLAV
ncbi:ETX/MTX2 family pore-forming toxin [Paenibacillus sp. NPDC057967]|uniref:ETX/MTX2 family pore-forming toxin n=1 Tax=Paenibacillus sp. NPDC057967 TaxID=3346293 RepID=UPI0036D8B379